MQSASKTQPFLADTRHVRIYFTTCIIKLVSVPNHSPLCTFIVHGKDTRAIWRCRYTYHISMHLRTTYPCTYVPHIHAPTYIQHIYAPTYHISMHLRTTYPCTYVPHILASSAHNLSVIRIFYVCLLLFH